MVEEIDLFKQLESKSDTIKEGTEELAFSLIMKRFYAFKKNTILSAMKMFTLKNEEDSTEMDIKKAIESLISREKAEFPRVYKPIYQIEEFETARVPLFFKEDGEIESLLLKLFSYFFPGSKIEKTDKNMELTLNTVPFRRFVYFSNLVEDNSSWNSFLFEHFRKEINIVNHGNSLIRSLFSEESDLFHFSKTKEEFEENAAFNYEKITLKIAYRSESYFSKCFEIGDYNSGAKLFNILNHLIALSSCIHIISDSYAEINESVNAEFEKEKAVYLEKQQAAYANFEEEISSRIVPVSSLNHKSAEAYADKLGIKEVYVPYSNNEVLTTRKNVQFSVYLKSSDNDKQEWLLLPPAKDIIELEQMEYQGVLDYVEFEKDSYLSKKENSPHVVGLDSRLNTKIDEDLFMSMLLETQKDSPHYQAILDSMKLLKAFAQTFKKLDRLSCFSKDVKNNQEHSKTGDTLVEAMKRLEVKVKDSDKKMIVRTGDLIEVSDEITLSDGESINLKDKLFSISSIDFVCNKTDSDEKYYTPELMLKPIVVKNSDSRSSIDWTSLTFALKDDVLFIPNAAGLKSYYEQGQFKTAANADSEKNKIIDFAIQNNLTWHQLKTTGGLAYEPSKDASEDVIEEIEDVPEEPNLPYAVRSVSSEYVYLFDNETEKVELYRNKELIDCISIGVDSSGSRIEEAIRSFVSEREFRNCGVVLDEHTFVLPIYKKETGEVFKALIFD